MAIILDDLRIQRAAASRRSEVDPSRLGFGDHFSDHMFSLRCRDGVWGQPEIRPPRARSGAPGVPRPALRPVRVRGAEAFRGTDGRVRVFRPDRNAARFRDSCRRLCIPRFPTASSKRRGGDRAHGARWIPRGRGEALYVRPLIFAEDAHLQVRPSMRYRLLVFTSPVTNYYNREAGAVSLKAQSRYTRAAPGGVGFAKTGATTRPALFPATESIAEGFDQALWLDGTEHRYVEEVGQMNIFFDFEGRVATPELRGTILPGTPARVSSPCSPITGSRSRSEGSRSTRSSAGARTGRCAKRSEPGPRRSSPRSPHRVRRGDVRESTTAPPGRSARSSTTRSSASSSASAKTGTGGTASSRSTPAPAQAAD